MKNFATFRFPVRILKVYTKIYAENTIMPNYSSTNKQSFRRFSKW